MSRRVFVCISGGVVDEVIVPPETDGTWTVIDWDNIESDPAREWGQFDEEDRKYIKENYSDDYAKYFLQFKPDPGQYPPTLVDELEDKLNWRRKDGLE